LNLKRYIESIETILEAPYSQYVGTFGRPDDRSGRAYQWHSEVEPKTYPYDRDDDGGAETAPRFSGYGQGRGQGKHEPSFHPPTPLDTGHTAWAEPGERSNKSSFEEASGTPINFTQSGKGGSMLGNPAPGAGGARGWSGSPTHPWDSDEETEDAIEAYGNNPIESKNPEVDDPTDPTDTDDAQPYSFTDFPSVIANVVGSGFGTGLGKTNPSGRGYMNGWTEDYDILAAESAWAAFAKFVGISD
jgi:hypothetical protein